MLVIDKVSVNGEDNVPLLREVSLRLGEAECVGLTGASGSGKTTLLRTIMGILGPGLSVGQGQVWLDQTELLSRSAHEHRKLCGTVLGFIPQNPMTAFNRYKRIGKQMAETFMIGLNISKADAVKMSAETLRAVNLTDTERILSAYPGQLSGGMLQRVTMAILWGLQPDYILADEPTSALDQENRDHLLKLLKQYPKPAAMLFLSHDAVALRSLCKRIAVMAQGQIVEAAETEVLFASPKAEWTRHFVARADGDREEEWIWEQL